ncbi:MAG TPA: ABC transporter permease [Candidatus Acidoferrum sp.]|nr:ABC transporter permease [Candidatus Acidoferrum sp.]
MEWSRFFRRHRVDEELSREIDAHIEIETEQNIARGMSPEEARYAARRKLGSTRRIREDVYSMNTVGFLETLLQDLKYGLRVLRRSPGFTAVTVLTLALGIGANTAIFSIVDAVFLRPLPFPHSDRIFVVDRVGNRFGGHSLSMPMFLAWRRDSQMFEHFALVSWQGPESLSGDSGEPERIRSIGVSTEFFPALGVQPAIGLGFQPDQGRVGGPRVALLSDGLWRTRFGAAPSVIGRTVRMDDESYTIIGVMPRDLELPLPGMRNAQVFVPIRIPDDSQDPSNGGLLCVGLLKPGVAPEQAASALTPALSELRTRFPNMFTPEEKAHLELLRTFIGDWAGPAPLLLFGAVGLVLLIACANVANLSLARSTSRQREIAVRAAMGAGRRRIVRQLLTESTLLAILGGLVGLAVCYASFGAIIGLVPTSIPHVGAYQIDLRVLAFALLLSLVTGLLFGLAPAVGASRVGLSASLQESNTRSGGGRGRLRRGLAVAEVSISAVLLIGAALALESFSSVMHVPPGFDVNNLSSVDFSLSPKQYDTPEKRAAFIGDAITRLEALPGVESVAMTSSLPLRGGPDTLFSIVGRPEPTNLNEAPDALFRVVSPEYFHTLRIPVERGRMFADSDNASSQAVMIINRAMAQWLWPEGDALGQHIWVGKPMGPAYTEPSAREIVGIVADAREMTLAEPPFPTMYLPASQSPGTNGGSFLVRAGAVSAASIRSVLTQFDAQHPVGQVQTMDQTLMASVTDWRFRAILLTLFGALALFIATIGVYGVISYWVAQRTHEIGIRMALGATRRDVLGLVIGQGVLLALIGVVVGVVAAAELTRFMADMLYGVKPTDPLTFAGMSLLLIIVALLACYVPARRAMRVDPMVALRYE